MRTFDQLSLYRVTATAQEVSAFAATWPASRLPDAPFWVVFKTGNNDIIEHKTSQGFQSADPRALSELCSIMMYHATTKFAFRKVKT